MCYWTLHGKQQHLWMDLRHLVISKRGRSDTCVVWAHRTVLISRWEWAICPASQSLAAWLELVHVPKHRPKAPARKKNLRPLLIFLSCFLEWRNYWRGTKIWAGSLWNHLPTHICRPITAVYRFTLEKMRGNISHNLKRAAKTAFWEKGPVLVWIIWWKVKRTFANVKKFI